MAREPANSVPKRLATISTGSCADTVLIVAAGSANIGNLRCCFQKSTSIVRRVPTGGRRNGKNHADNVSVSAIPIMTASARSEEHTSELQSLMRISYAVFCLKKK